MRVPARGIFILLSLLSSVLISSYGLAEEKKSMVVNIDSPNFRKLIMAIPHFHIDAVKGSELDDTATRSREELKKLLTFSGLFNFMSDVSYRGIMKSGGVDFTKKSDSLGLGGVKVNQWKTIGVESLTTGKMSESSEGLSIEMRTIDINRGVSILAKKFTHIKDIEKVMRRYADLLLKAYTGKSGIFSSRIVFIGRKTKGSYKQVYIADFDGSNVRQITNDKSIHLSPSWSPDGEYVLYTSYKSGNPDLYLHHIATGKVRKLAGYKGLNSGGAFSPEGKVVAMTGTIEGDADIYITSPNGGSRKAIIRGNGLDVDPTFSPDGKWIAFVSGRYGNPHIFRGTLDWNSDRTALRVVKDKRLTYAGWYNATPAWSPDSEKLAFAGYDKEIDRFDIFMMNHDGSKLERLTLRTGDNESPSWSPNGQMLVFQSNRVGTRNIKSRAQLYIMNRDGSGQRKIETGLYEAQTPRWGPQTQ